MQDVCKRISDYLDGDLEAAISLPHHLMDLEFELELEEDSEWMDQTLGKKASVKDEMRWRNIIDMMLEKDTIPKHVCADKKFLGGKQFQRAKELLMAAMAGNCCIIMTGYMIFPLIASHSHYCHLHFRRGVSRYNEDESFRGEWSRVFARWLATREWERGKLQYSHPLFGQD